MSRSSGRRQAILLTCEHGGNRIPERYRSLFESPAAQQALESHRGWDAGALQIAEQWKRALKVPLITSQTSRLLIDLNRSIGHPKVYSEWTRTLPDAVRQSLIDRHYTPYRDKVVATIQRLLVDHDGVLHLSLHSFTPIWNGLTRPTDIGLLFDPGRPQEASLCSAWQQQLRRCRPDLKTHRNRPYRGTSDGLTTSLRRRFAASKYLGIELEVNQRLFSDAREKTQAVMNDLADSLRQAQSSCESKRE